MMIVMGLLTIASQCIHIIRMRMVMVTEMSLSPLHHVTVLQRLVTLRLMVMARLAAAAEEAVAAAVAVVAAVLEEEAVAAATLILTTTILRPIPECLKYAME